VIVQVCPPSFEVAELAESLEDRLPPATIPFKGLRKATEIAPALAELTSGVSKAFQVSPPSRVVRTRATAAPPVTIQAFCQPCVVMQVPLAAKEASPGSAGGMLLAIDSQVKPSVVRSAGKTPLTESL